MYKVTVTINGNSSYDGSNSVYQFPVQSSWSSERRGCQ